MSITKKFSFKNIKKRFASEDGGSVAQSSRHSSSSSSTLPLDVEKGESGVARPSANGSNLSDIDTSGRSRSSRSEDIPPVPAFPPGLNAPSASISTPTVPSIPLDPLQNLATTGIMDKVNEGPKDSKAENLLNKIDDAVASAQDPKGIVVTVVQPVKMLLENTGAMKAIEKGINSFMEDIPWLMKGLDEIARIHPVVTVAVLAFKAVYNMELTRRENDRRIRALYVEMKDMMAVLIQLKDVKDKDDLGPDGRTVEARLQGLVKQAADDIKDCANACDTYAKKRLLVKVLKGYSWEAKLVAFAGVFTKRRTEFEQALSIHTARMVGAIHDDVQQVQVSMEAVNTKLEIFTKIFEKLAPQDLVTIKTMVKEQGDVDGVLGNEGALKKLNDYENSLDTKDKSDLKSDYSRVRSAFSVKDLREELRYDFEVSVQRNWSTFEGKFQLYTRQLQDQLTKTINEANNRVINAVKEGPHDRIKNQELKTIWKEMTWRRNVKARLFVMTLRDHFREKAEDFELDADIFKSKEDMRTDDWALEYISINWLQPIMEAFDDDGSGYITIAEINRFTESMPTELNWSLQHWIAYWATGWQFAATRYVEKINRIIDLMYALRPRILPGNRYDIDYYLSKVWPTIVDISSGLQASELPEELHDKFLPYMEYEEARIRRNLQDIRFDIDALDTVYVVAGHGRIEKYLLPLLYLLLERDLKIFRVAQSALLHDDELWDSAESISYLFEALKTRQTDLQTLYEQKNLNTDDQFKTVACGLFANIYDSSELWTISNIVDQHFSYSNSVTQELVDENGYNSELDTALNYPLRAPEDISYIYEKAITTPPPTGIIFGQWSGYIYVLDEFPENLMWVWIFEPVPENDYAFRASGVDYDLDPYVLEGTYSISDDGVVEVDFQITYESGSPQEYYKGRIDEKGSLIGFKGFSPDNVTEDSYASRFIVRRIPPDIMVHRPSPMEFEKNAPRALWKFARDTIMMQTRRKMWSWSYFRSRRDLRRRYVDLNIRTWEYGPPPSSEETEEFLASRKALMPDDALVALSIRKALLRTLPKHFDIPCDGCGEPIGGARIICMDCRKNDSELWHTVDFCDDPRCYSVTVTAQNRDYLEKPHLPTHTFMKIRTYVHWRDLIDAASNAQSELDRYRGPNAGETSESDSDEAEDETDETREVKNEESSDGDEDASGEKCDHESSVEEEAGSDDQQSSRSSTAAKLSNCFACHSPTEMPCWYCTVCTDCVICDSCESQTLLPCVACNKTFIQPTWWYGSESKDRFVCNVCTVKGAEPSEKVDSEALHVYTHPLVRARERVDDEDSEPSTTADRLELLESTVRSIQDSFNTRFGKLEDTLALLQQAITNLMELKSESQTT